MQRLRQRSDFLAAAKGPRVAGPAFVVQARDRQDEGSARVGFTVSKKVGTAVGAEPGSPQAARDCEGPRPSAAAVGL